MKATYTSSKLKTKIRAIFGECIWGPSAGYPPHTAYPLILQSSYDTDCGPSLYTNANATR